MIYKLSEAETAICETISDACPSFLLYSEDPVRGWWRDRTDELFALFGERHGFDPKTASWCGDADNHTWDIEATPIKETE